MTLDELQAILPDENAIKHVFRKDETFALLKGHFTPGRVPYVHKIVFPDTSQLCLKFYNTVKQALNTKGQSIYGKESFLSYMEVSIAPVGKKAYCFSLDVNQVAWGASKSKATKKHAIHIASLVGMATTLGIDLSIPSAWATIYTESY
ncbi:MAG: hypothetical protein DDT31_00310 [Syntrophomonadaceae bacterium]|nr:hypothetical protein [Bacillota bacterium]